MGWNFIRYPAISSLVQLALASITPMLASILSLVFRASYPATMALGSKSKMSYSKNTRSLFREPNPQYLNFSRKMDLKIENKLA